MAALGLICWQFLLSNPGMFVTDPLPGTMQLQENLLIAGAVLVILVGYDIRRYLKSSASCKDQFKQYQSQISELFDEILSVENDAKQTQVRINAA